LRGWQKPDSVIILRSKHSYEKADKEKPRIFENRAASRGAPGNPVRLKPQNLFHQRF